MIRIAASDNKSLEARNAPFDSLDIRLLELLEEFSSTLATYKLQVPATSPASLERLKTTPWEIKARLIHSFELWLGWIRPEAATTGSLELDKNRERGFAEKAMAHFNLHACSEVFWDKMKDGQIIEIYGQDMIQLYRSLSFFKFCGYSLLDISLYEFYVLWDRPKRALELLVDQAELAMVNRVECDRIHTPRHIIREGFQTGLPDLKPRAYLAEFMHVSSLLDATGRPQAFICTSEGEFLAEGNDAFTIQFV